MRVSVLKVRAWLDSVGDAYISKKDLGDSLDSAYSLQEECLNIEAQLMVSTQLLKYYTTVDILPTTAMLPRDAAFEGLGWHRGLNYGISLEHLASLNITGESVTCSRLAPDPAVWPSLQPQRRGSPYFRTRLRGVSAGPHLPRPRTRL